MFDFGSSHILRDLRCAFGSTRLGDDLRFCFQRSTLHAGFRGDETFFGEGRGGGSSSTGEGTLGIIGGRGLFGIAEDEAGFKFEAIVGILRGTAFASGPVSEAGGSGRSFVFMGFEASL